MSWRGIQVTLEWSEVALAERIGALRNVSALRKGLKPGHECNGDDNWTIHIEGAGGELAAAKALGVYWAGTVDTFKKGGDVGNYQVRKTDKDSGRLIIRPDDPPAIYVLAVGKIPNFRVAGWFDYSGREVLREEWLTNFGHEYRTKAHGIPQTALRPIEELRDHNARKPIPAAENYTPPVQTQGQECERHPLTCFCEKCTA